MTRAKAKVRLEQMARFKFVWVFIFVGFPIGFRCFSVVRSFFAVCVGLTACLNSRLHRACTVANFPLALMGADAIWSTDLPSTIGGPRAENGTIQTMHFLALSECISSLAMLSWSVRLAARAIVGSSSVRMTRTVTRLAPTEITPPFVEFSSTTTSGLFLRFGAGGRSEKLLSAVLTAKVVRLAIALSAESGCFVDGHSANRVFGYGFRVLHGRTPLLMLIVILLLLPCL